MNEWKSRVFWKKVSVKEFSEGFGIELDQAPPKTPKKNPFIVPNQILAEEIKREFESQKETINPSSMLFTRLSNTAIDLVPARRNQIVDTLLEFGSTDLLYHFTKDPVELETLLEEKWKPIIQWVENEFGISINTGIGILPVSQAKKTQECFRNELEHFNDFTLIGIGEIIPALGSLILGFAYIKGFVDPETAWNLSRLDNEFQISRWGMDDEEVEVTLYKKNEYLKVCKFIELAKT